MAYVATTFVFGEQPSAAKWNQLGGNDAAFNNGTGLPTANSDNNFVTTSQTTTSTSYDDLSTVQSVSVDVGATGMLLVGYSANFKNDTSNAFCYASPALSGATTDAASDNYCVKYQAYAGHAEERKGSTKLYIGLTPGSTTVTLKFRVQTGGGGAGTGTFSNRELWAIPL